MAQQSRTAAEIQELEAKNAELMEEVDKYRTATEDALQQLDWCIGYFAASKNRGVAKSLGANRAYIRTRLLGRAEQPLPTKE